MAASGRCLTRAAASSIAKGRPSSLRQISTTSKAVSRSRSRFRLTAFARSQKSAVAGQRTMSSGVGSVTPDGNSKGGTANSCSPRSRRALRLVTRKVVSGHLRSREYTSGAAGVRCSKVSRTTSAFLPVRRLVRSSSRSAPVSTTPRLFASSGATKEASFNSPSETKKTPPRKEAPICWVISMASRVFPMPPGPVSVSSLTSGP